MPRFDGLRRAAFFDDASYTECTLETYDERTRRYKRAAADAGIESPLEAPSEWIVGFFANQAFCSVTQARRQLPAVAHYFRVNGRADAFPYDAISDLLRETSDLAADPLGAHLSSVRVPSRQRRRARAFTNEAMKETRALYARMAQGWEIYGRRYSIDPLHATPQQFRGFLSVYARTHRYRSLSNLCSALSNYFRAAHVDDLTRNDQVRELLVVVARQDAESTQYRPLYAEDLWAMVCSLGEAPLDVRDRSILLLNYYGTFFGGDLCRIDTDVVVQDDGIVLKFEGRSIFIGGVNDPNLDVRAWMIRWLDILPKGRGPLFPAATARGDWMQVPMAEATICSIVRKAARRANISVPYPTLALRKGYAIRVNRVHGPIQTAAQMRLKRTCSLEAHVGLDKSVRSRNARGGGNDQRATLSNPRSASPESVDG
jgi:hypothetical protein